MTIGNDELMHECFPQHLRMGTAKMKKGSEREDDKMHEHGKKYRGHKKNEVPTA